MPPSKSKKVTNPLFDFPGEPEKPKKKLLIKPARLKKQSPMGAEFQQYLLDHGYSPEFVLQYIRRLWGPCGPHSTQSAVGF